MQDRIAQVVPSHPIAVVPLDPSLQLVSERLVPEDARAYRGALRVGQHDALPQAGRAAAVLHRIPQVQVANAAHRSARGGDAFEESSRARLLARLLRSEDGHAAVREREHLRIERICRDGRRDRQLGL